MLALAMKGFSIGGKVSTRASLVSVAAILTLSVEGTSVSGPDAVVPCAAPFIRGRLETRLARTASLTVCV